MESFDLWHLADVWLVLVVSIDVLEDDDFGVLTVGANQIGHLVDVGRAPTGIRLMSGALEFGEEVASVETPFDDGSMAIGQGVAVVGGEEVVFDRLVVEANGGENVPHKLTVARLEVMRTAVRPDVNAIEERVELKVKEEVNPNLENEMIIMFIRVICAKEIKITTGALTILAVVLEHEDTVLHADAGSRLIGRHGRGEIHQDKKLTRPEDRPRNGVLTALT